MKSLTYEEWKEIGYQVLKGERATGKNKDGRPTFVRDQVDDIPNGPYWNETEEELHPGHHDTYWED